ncbi:MAG: bifunctional folylpolyglutamate synthase/dihydrofolate synthase [Bacillus sp. (in: firmicutes)]
MIKHIDEMYTYFEKREKSFGMNFGLERMHQLLASLEVDHGALRFVHIAGTNGKGSTLNFLKRILCRHGLRVGSFTSPHIETVQERIMINDDWIPESDFLRLFNHVIGVVENMEEQSSFPTQFEILTVIALLYFQEQAPDLILMEAGLGGRLDSTNVIEPLLSIITNVSKDHMNVLGDTIEQIAGEKAGIIKKGCPVVTGARHQDALKVIKKKASETKSVLFALDNQIRLANTVSVDWGEQFDYLFANYSFRQLGIRMIGRHQVDNAALAVTAALYLQEPLHFVLVEELMREGLQEANWRGRLETISDSPTIIVDGSHNEEGIRTMVQTIEERYKNRDIIVVMATLADKDNEFMVSEIEKITDQIIFTEFEAVRALPAEELAGFGTKAGNRVEKSWEQALDAGLADLDSESLLLVTGSLYFLYYSRAYLKARVAE